VAVEVVAAIAVAVDHGVSMSRQGNFWAEPMRSWYCYWSSCDARVQECVKPWRHVTSRLRLRFVLLTGVRQIGSIVVVATSVIWLSFVFVLIIAFSSICISIQEMHRTWKSSYRHFSSWIAYTKIDMKYSDGNILKNWCKDIAHTFSYMLDGPQPSISL
jgi:hypothetical protein